MPISGLFAFRDNQVCSHNSWYVLTNFWDGTIKRAKGPNLFFAVTHIHIFWTVIIAVFLVLFQEGNKVGTPVS